MGLLYFPYQEKSYSLDLPVEYHNIYHFIYYNPLFDQEYMPQPLLAKMKSALKLYEAYCESNIPSNLPIDLHTTYLNVS